MVDRVRVGSKGGSVETPKEGVEANDRPTGHSEAESETPEQFLIAEGFLDESAAGPRNQIGTRLFGDHARFSYQTEQMVRSKADLAAPPAHDYSKVIEALTLLLAPIVPPVNRSGNRLNLDTFRSMKRFERFQNYLVQHSGVNDNVMGDALPVFVSYQKLLQKFRPLLEILYQQIDPEYPVSLDAGEAASLVRQLEAGMIAVDADRFVQNFFYDREGRDRLRRILKDPLSPPSGRVALIKAVARAARETEGVTLAWADKVLKNFSFFDFKLDTSPEVLAQAASDALHLLQAAEVFFSKIDQDHERVGKKAERLYHPPVAGRSIDAAEIKKYQKLAAAGWQRSDAVGRLQEKLARLWLFAANGAHWKHFAPFQENAEPLRTFILDRTEPLIRDLQKVKEDGQLKQIHQRVAAFLNDPIETEGLPVTGPHLRHRLAKDSLVENLSLMNHHRRTPLTELQQLNDKYHHRWSLGKRVLRERESLAPVWNQADRQALEGLIGALDELDIDLDYGYKQHPFLSRLGSWFRDKISHGGDRPDIRRANAAIDQFLRQLELAYAPEHIEAILEEILQSLEEGGTLYNALVAAEMDGIEQSIGLLQTSIEIVVGVYLIGGAGHLARLAKLKRGIDAAQAAKAADTTEKIGVAARMRRATATSTVVLAENTLAELSDQAGRSPLTIEAWFKDWVSTALAMAAMAALRISPTHERNFFKMMHQRYLARGPQGFVTSFGMDGGLESVEEIFDQYVRQVLDGNWDLLSWAQVRELLKLCMGGAAPGAAKVWAFNRGPIHPATRSSITPPASPADVTPAGAVIPAEAGIQPTPAERYLDRRREGKITYYNLSALVGLLSAGFRADTSPKHRVGMEERLARLLENPDEAARLHAALQRRGVRIQPLRLEDDIYQTDDPRRSIVELVSNAIDASQEDVEVSVRDGFYEVSDRGRGMPPDVILKRLLIPKLSTKMDPGKQIGRFGIGFYTVLRHLQAEGDRVEVETWQNGKGYRLVFVKRGGKIKWGVQSLDAVPSESGTRVRLHARDIRQQAMRAEMERYLRYVNDGRSLKVNGKKFSRGETLQPVSELNPPGSYGTVYHAEAQTKRITVKVGELIVESYEVTEEGVPGDLVIAFPHSAELTITRDALVASEPVLHYVRQLIGRIDNLRQVHSLLPWIKALDQRHEEKPLLELLRAKTKELVEKLPAETRIYPDNGIRSRLAGAEAAASRIYIAPELYDASWWDRFATPGEFAGGHYKTEGGWEIPIRVVLAPDLDGPLYLDAAAGVLYINETLYRNRPNFVWSALFMIPGSEFAVRWRPGLERGAEVAMEREGRVGETPVVERPRQAERSRATPETRPAAAEGEAKPVEKIPPRVLLLVRHYLESLGFSLIDLARRFLTGGALFQGVKAIESEGQTWLIVGTKSENFYVMSPDGRVLPAFEGMRLDNTYRAGGKEWLVTKREDGTKALFSLHGEMKIPFGKYIDLYVFESEGQPFAKVKGKDGLWGILSLDGKEIIPIKYNSLPLHRHGRQVFISADNEKGIGVFTADGRVVVPVEHKFVAIFEVAGEVWIKARNREGKMGLFSADGRQVVPYQFNDIEVQAIGGRIWVRAHRPIEDLDQMRPFRVNQKLEIFPLEGEGTYPFVEFDYVRVVRSSDRSYVAVKKGDAEGVFFEDGKALIELRDRQNIRWEKIGGQVYFIVSERSISGDRSISTVITADGRVLFTSEYEVGSAVEGPEGEVWFEVEQNMLKGYLNSKGEVVIPVEYEELSMHHVGGKSRIIARQIGKYGLLSPEGRVLIPFVNNALYVHGTADQAWVEVMAEVHGSRGMEWGLYSIDGDVLVPVGEAHEASAAGDWVFVSTGEGVHLLDGNRLHLLSESWGHVLESAFDTPVAPIIFFNAGYYLPLADLVAIHNSSELRQRLKALNQQRLELSPFRFLLFHASPELWSWAIRPENRALAAQIHSHEALAFVEQNRNTLSREKLGEGLSLIRAIPRTGSLDEQTYVDRIRTVVAESGIDLQAVLSSLQVDQRSELADALRPFLTQKNVVGVGQSRLASPRSRTHRLSDVITHLRLTPENRRAAALEAVRNYSNEEDWRQLEQAVKHLHGIHPFLWIRELLQNSLDALRGGGEIHTHTFLQNGRLVFRIEDDGGMTEEEFLGLFLPGEGSKRDRADLRGGFGLGFKAALAGADWVRLQTAVPGSPVVYFAEIEVLRDAKGEIQDIRLKTETKPNRENFHGTVVETQRVQRLAMLEASQIQTRLKDIGQYIPNLLARLTHNGEPVNANTKEALVAAEHPGLGRVELFDGLENRLLLGGLPLTDLPAELWSEIPEGIQEYYRRMGFYLNLDHTRLLPTPTRDRLRDQEKIFAQLRRLLPGLLLKGFLKRVTSLHHPEDLDRLPQEYFIEAYRLASSASIGKTILQDGEKINAGQLEAIDMRPYALGEGGRRNLLKLLTVIRFVPVEVREGETRLMSLREIHTVFRRALRGEAEAKELLEKIRSAPLPASIRERLFIAEVDHAQAIHVTTAIQKGGELRRRGEAAVEQFEPNRTYSLEEVHDPDIRNYLEGVKQITEAVARQIGIRKVEVGLNTLEDHASAFAYHYRRGSSYHLFRSFGPSLLRDVEQLRSIRSNPNEAQAFHAFQAFLVRLYETLTHELTHVDLESPESPNFTHDAPFRARQRTLMTAPPFTEDQVREWFEKWGRP